MKIFIYLERSPVRGGIEIFAERHAEALRKCSNDVTIGSCVPDRQHDYDSIIVHKCSSAKTLERFDEVKTTYYVHDHEPICPRRHAYTALGNNCSRCSGVWPCIICAPVCRSPLKAVCRVMMQRRRLRTMSHLGRIVVISQFMKSRLIKNGIRPQIISVEPPVISTNGIVRSSAPDIDILYAGQLIRGKGVHLLLRALALVNSSRSLDIVGTGNMEKKLRKLSERLGVAGRVRFHGFQTDARSWMARARCVVVPSFWQEPYGLVAAEAVALGIKTVVFNVGGLPEAAQGKATLVEPCNILALAHAIEETC